MSDKIGKGNPYGSGPDSGRPLAPQTISKAPRRDAPGSVESWGAGRAGTPAATDQRVVGHPTHGDFIEGSKDSVMSTHVEGHIMGGRDAPDASFGVRHASNEYPKRSGGIDFSQGDAGKGTGYTPKGDAGHTVK